MRISTAYSFDSAIANLQKRQNDLTESQMQLTTGKRVNNASDDPVAAARAERALATMSRSDANQRGLEASRNAMTLGSGVLRDSVELLQQARESLVKAGNGSYSDAERNAPPSPLPMSRDVASRPPLLPAMRLPFANEHSMPTSRRGCCVKQRRAGRDGRCKTAPLVGSVRARMCHPNRAALGARRQASWRNW